MAAARRVADKHSVRAEPVAVGQFVGGRTIQVPAVVWTRLPIMALTVVRGDDERADDPSHAMDHHLTAGTPTTVGSHD
jgi:hypothetical protein